MPRMDLREAPVDKALQPRRELQGPRPTPLKVSKDSRKIKKPPLPPPPQAASLPPPQPRPPVIIYTLSPKVIHASASEFMSLVQRLTGRSPSPAAAGMRGGLSPAARLAAIEKTHVPETKNMEDGDMDVDIPTVLDRGAPGVLSPVPSSLPSISPNFFSPSVDLSSFSFLHDLSPFAQNNSFMDRAFLSPTMTSPTLPFDLFNQLFD